MRQLVAGTDSGPGDQLQSSYRSPGVLQLAIQDFQIRGSVGGDLDNAAQKMRVSSSGNF